MTQGVRKKDGKTGRGYPINAMVVYRNLTFVVDWTCPKCNLRNTNQPWLGRRYHTCERCNQQSDIKGHNIGMNKTTMNIYIL